MSIQDKPSTELDNASLRKQLLDERAKILEDQRLAYPTATVFENAFLALIQYGETCRVHTIEKILGIKLTKFPYKPEKDDTINGGTEVKSP